MRTLHLGLMTIRTLSVYLCLLITTASMSFSFLSNGAMAGTTSAEPIKPINFRLLVPAEKAPLLELNLKASDTYNTGFEGGKIYLSCYRGRFDYFRLNLVLSSNVAFMFERYPKAFVGVKSVDADMFFPNLPMELEGSSEAETPPLLFELADSELAFQRGVGFWDEYEVGDESFLYVSSHPNSEFFRTLSASNVLYLIFFDEETGKYYSALSVFYELESAVLTEFEEECRKE